MSLYIQIENGLPINHPALEENIFQAFGLIPPNWESFTRIVKPTPTIYQILDSNTPTYAKVNGVWADVWVLRDMTAEEKVTKQQAVRDEFNAREQASNWSAWTLDEATCEMVPPIPRPALVEGVTVFWSGADSNWKEAPARPVGDYKFDFIAWAWVAR